MPLESDSVAGLMTGSLPLAPAARPHDTLPSMTGSHELARVHTHTHEKTNTYTHSLTHIDTLYRTSKHEMHIPADWFSPIGKAHNSPHK